MSNSSFEDIETELSEMGFALSISDFEKSIRSEESIHQSSNVRGEGITANNYMANIRCASELNDLKIHHAPLGHMPTSSELLNTYHENEITPLLRKLGISGHDGELSSRRTRQVPKLTQEIRFDGNVPVILNGDLFHMSNYYDSDYDSDGPREEHEADDPSLPLEQRFSTIMEFKKVSSKTQTYSEHFNKSASSSTEPKSSKTCSSSSDRPDISSHSTTADDASSASSTSATTFSAGDQCSNEWKMEPLLLKKGKLYTPRQLYAIKNVKDMRPGVSRQ